jgi:hypothetical protein
MRSLVAQRARSMQGSKAWRIKRRACVLLVLLEGCLAVANFGEFLFHALG